MLARHFSLQFVVFFFCSLTISFAQKDLITINGPGGFSTERLERYEQFLEKEIEAGNIPGAVSLIMRKGEIAHEKAFGYNNVADKTAMQQNQIFYIQSMTKPIVTVALMMLYEEGHFFLGDKVSKYLPFFKDIKVAKDVNAGLAGETVPADSEITIAQLMSHTAGFSHGLGGSQLDQDVLKTLYFSPHENVEGRVKALVSTALVAQPGERFYYSAATDVLSLLIEHFSGKTTNEFLEERIFGPLKMEDTGYNINEEQQKRRVQLHNKNKEGKLMVSEQQPPVSGNTIYGGTHGLFSTAADYMKFSQMLLNKGEANGQRFLSRKTIELMTADQLGDDRARGPGLGFGLGFGVVTDQPETLGLHSEGTFYWGGAYCTYFFIDPEEELVGVLMTQLAPFTSFYENKMRQLIYQAIDD